MASLETQLTDEAISLSNRVVALLELCETSGETEVSFVHRANAIIPKLARALDADVVCLDCRLQDGSVVKSTKFSDREYGVVSDVSSMSYYDSIQVNPKDYDRFLRDNGFHEIELDLTGTNIPPFFPKSFLIVPVMDGNGVKGYLGVQRAVEFNRLDIKIAQTFADNLSRFNKEQGLGERLSSLTTLQNQILDELIKNERYILAILQTTELNMKPHLERKDIQKVIYQIGKTLDTSISIFATDRNIKPFLYQTSYDNASSYLNHYLLSLSRKEDMKFFDQNGVSQVWGKITFRGEVLGYAGAIRYQEKEFTRFEGTYFLAACQPIGIALQALR